MIFQPVIYKGGHRTRHFFYDSLLPRVIRIKLKYFSNVLPDGS
jgi:hypothetical protein